MGTLYFGCVFLTRQSAVKLAIHYTMFFVQFTFDLPLCGAKACLIAYKYMFDLILYGFDKSKGKLYKKVVECMVSLMSKVKFKEEQNSALWPLYRLA